MGTRQGIKRIVALVLAMILVFSLMPMAYAIEGKDSTSVKKVKLGYFSFQNYMLGAGQGETKSGFAYDLLCDVAAINNWEYEFVYGDFNELYEKLLNNEIDILPCLVYTEERAAVHLFSDEEIYAEQYFISAKNENVNRDFKISDLNGKKISSVNDTHQNEVFLEWAKENGISCQLVCTPSFDDSWKQLDDGKTDYILNIDSASQDSGYTSLLSVGSGSSRFAIAPKDTEILHELNSAIAKIYEINPFSIAHLKEKYLKDTMSSYKLSQDEQNWLSGREVIRVAGLKDDLPYTYSKSGAVVGVYPDMIKSMFNKLGISTKVEWTLYASVEEMHEALASGEVDLVCPDYYGHFYASENDVIVSEKIQDINMGLLTEEKTLERDIDRIAIPDSRLVANYVSNVYPKAEIVLCKTVDDCLKEVNSGRADAAIAHIAALQEKSSKSMKTFRIRSLNARCPICFSTSQENGMLICILNRGLHLISDFEFQTLENEHTPSGDYALWNYIKNNKLLVTMMAIAIFAIVAYAWDRTASSRKLKKNLDEITRQKEIIEKNEKELVEAKNEANAASRAKTTFLFNMSHDIRTPMNAILGYSDRMLRHIDNKEIVADSAGKIKSSGAYLLSLINDVLDMARIESDKAKIEVSLNDIRERGLLLCDIFEVDMQKKDLTFNVDLDDVTDKYVWYDSLKVRQIMLNLISNAVKYTGVGGTITHTMRQVECKKPGYGRYEFVIEDNGMGMTPEFVEHIFEQFSRSDDSITKGTQGTGLGMSIVAKLVNLMGGTIDVKSEVGKGTKITIFLDFKLGTEEEINELLASEEPEYEKVSLNGVKILLVDDNELNREIAQDILTEEGCIVVDVAENGEIAVQKVAESEPGKFDVVLMDVQMPVMDGYQATRTIRELENTELANIPIIAMTANAFEEDRQNALAAGMNDHVAKPVDIAKLSKALAAIIKS